MTATYSDTMDPRNLYDWELSEDTTTLPDPRPLTESTPATYMIAQGRLFRALGRIPVFNNTPGPYSYDTVLEIDNAVHKAYQNFPPHHENGRCRRRDKLRESYIQLLKSEPVVYVSQRDLHPTLKAYGQRQNHSPIQILSGSVHFIYSDTPELSKDLGSILLELGQRFPDVDASSDTEALLQTLEMYSTYWEKAKDSCDEAWKVHQILSGMLSGFRPGTATDLPQTLPSGLSFEIPGFSPQLPELTSDCKVKNDLSNMGIDWATWDAFIEDATFENGPVYRNTAFL
ncbi:hypothetical protein NUU61_000173 [Penicillium alfredii]|uniref:Uncharacterized protein n=1 Tax=Penicillium alfredii TaxID=1506179 RepID=A0A9W9G934_9EURO|nr:uncharacterized protein NUU61_000173 [Penicillium alfredii]KAJ5114414.1 hypothetical protein NUU61_000173 [Penicillium alfredii]